MVPTDETLFSGVEISTSEDETPYEEEIFDFSSPENIIILCTKLYDDGPDGWKNYSIEHCEPFGGKDGVTGAASYDKYYGCFLDYTVKGLIDPPGDGWFVVENVTGVYHKGDGWITDDDMDFYYEGVRPATPEEIKEFGDEDIHL